MRLNDMRPISVLIAFAFLLAACARSPESDATPTTAASPPAATTVDAPTTTVVATTTTVEATTTTVEATTTTVQATTTTMDAPTTTETPTPGSADQLPPGVLVSIIEDAAERTGVVSHDIQVVDVAAQEFSDASLGCPEQGMAYAQVITSGFQVLVESGGSELDYRVDGMSGDYRLCQQ